MPTYPAAQTHGAIREVFSNVFVVTGRVRMGPGVVMPRTMTVVREGRELVLINAMRLTAEGEAALAALGRPTHLLRIGASHGMDDAYCVERYKLALWAPTGAKDRGVPVAHALDAAAALPVGDAALFTFEHALPDVPERALVLARDGGVLVACDSVQNWTRATYADCSLLARPLLRRMGFGGAAQIGVVWRRLQERDAANGLRGDFQRLLAQRFRHLLTAHGEPLRDGAHLALAEQFRTSYPA